MITHHKVAGAPSQPRRDDPERAVSGYRRCRDWPRLITSASKTLQTSAARLLVPRWRTVEITHERSMTGLRPLIAGNWKMNGLKASASELGQMIAGADGPAQKADLLICPPATLVLAFAGAVRGSPIRIGSQDCHPKASGAHTGDISAEILADAGATAIIVGHSERRADHGETDALVRQKAEAAWRAGLTARRRGGRS